MLFRVFVADCHGHTGEDLTKLPLQKSLRVKHCASPIHEQLLQKRFRYECGFYIQGFQILVRMHEPGIRENIQ